MTKERQIFTKDPREITCYCYKTMDRRGYTNAKLFDLDLPIHESDKI